ncbi:serine-repeat antigen (SERA), truncated, putative [Plasmodium vivax]|uniref:Serine-repeat antigen (SERA), truncated, putative n=2 Tax=Plasmodium vivax TaxID=5855 RepID=A5KBM5_PLAVS|nr:serine-repeat antigen (SERA), truncated, putative [Plasmodium vivax]EDL43275.1 serine-repeat antigen (SERA), truncated, putative [Plasmodium vivax]KMZ88245.1 serine-repeat antigen (SERA) [Plasmodium vivax Brazil I]|eukprot:XP_001613002.1 serine-repeat antigen (SERA), truncated [Plasmodium vivax Sal-1]
MLVLFTETFNAGALLGSNAEGLAGAESPPGGVLGGEASDGDPLTEGASEQKRMMTKGGRPANRLGKCQTGQDPTPTIRRASPKLRRQSEGVGQANYVKVKALPFKRTIGVKINRTCGAEMGFLFIPHSSMYLTTEESKAGAFKMMTHIEDNAFPLNWRVYLPREPHTAAKRDATETKWHGRSLAGSNDGPCDEGHDFFSGGIDSGEDGAIPPMEKGDQPEGCSEEASEEESEDASEGCSEEASEEASEEQQLRISIERVLSGVYKVAADGRKVLITREELDDSLKEELKKYCQLLKKVDSSGTLEEHQMGSEMEVFDNLVNLLQKHGDETVLTLRRKLRNPAVCMKDVSEWVLKRRGLALPDSPSSNASEKDANLGVDPKWMECVRSNSREEGAEGYNGEEDGMVNLAKLKMRSKHFCCFSGEGNQDKSNGKGPCAPKAEEEVE